METILVHLDWPERCFRAERRETAILKRIAGPSRRVVRATDDAAFLKALPRADVAIVWRFKKEWFPLATRLKVLATPGAGRELVAWKDAPPGVRVHFGGFHGAIMAESVAAYVLAFARGFFRRELSGNAPFGRAWPRTALSDKCFTVAGTKAVVAGYGRVGRAIGAKLESLGVEVQGITRKNAADLPRLAKTADWLVMALPSDTGTDRILDAKLISKLPRRACVVNVGRGNAVDEPALLAALREGKIAGAYLDVFDGEPGPLSPAGKKCGAILSSPRRSLPPNLVVTPHSSAFSAEYLEMCFKELENDGCI